MNDGQLDIEIRFNSPEAKAQLSDIEKSAKAVNEESEKGNKPLKEREGIIERLKRRMNELREAQNGAMSVDGIAKVNRELQNYEQELIRVSRAGRTGFDANGQSMISNVSILQRLQQQAALWERGMQEATNPAALEKYSQKLALVNAEMSRLTKGQGTGGAGQWNGLQNSINQISRELPAFTYSIQTGFMAISNNLPILADEINRVKAANAALTASGQQAQPVWKQLVSSLLSWQTAMSVGIMLTTVYGKEIGNWISSLFKGTQAIDEAKMSLDAMNKSFEDNSFAKAVQDVEKLRNAVDMAKQGFVSKKSVVEEYNKTIGRTTGEVKTLNEVEKFLVDNADNYIKMTMYKAAANLALADAAKEAVEAEKTRIKELSEFNNNFLDAGLQARSEEQYKAQQNQQLKNQQERKDKQVKMHEDAEQKQLNISNKFMKKAQESASKMNLSVFGDNPKKPKDTSKQDENQFAQMLKSRKDAWDKIQALDNEYRVISFSDDEKEIEALKQKFADFRKIIEDENQKIADYNAKHKSKVELLDLASIDPIEKRATADTKYRQETKKEMDSLSVQKALYNEYEQYKNQTSEEQANKRYANDLEKAKGYYKNLTNQINVLQSKKDDGSISGVEKERLNKLEEQLKDFNKNKQAEEDRLFLESYNATKTHHDKLLDIDKKYKRLFAAQEGNLSDEQKEILKNARQDEIDALNEQEAHKTRIFIEAAKRQVVVTTAGIRAQIQVIKTLLKSNDLTPKLKSELEDSLISAETTAKLGARAATIINLKKNYKDFEDQLIKAKKEGASAEVIKKANDELVRTQIEIDNLNQEGFTDMLNLLRQVGQEVGKLGDMFSNLGNAFGNDLLSNVGGLFSGLAGGVEKLSFLFDKNAFSAENFKANMSNAIGAAVDLISMVGNAAAERRRAEEEYYRQVIDMQREYNMSLNDQLRLQSQIGESLYVKDYVGRMKDGVVAAEDAIKNYKKSIAELAEKGKVTKGLSNAVDWKNVGNGAVAGAVIGGVAAGALAGAAAGSIVPVVGTVIGAAVGAIIGIFSGKKKKPKYEDLWTKMPKEVADKLTSSEPQDLTDVKSLLESLNNAISR